MSILGVSDFHNELPIYLIEYIYQTWCLKVTLHRFLSAEIPHYTVF
jgi:hypothetical protein